MADTATPNYGLTQPEVQGSTGSWGDKWNGNFDLIDALVSKLRTDAQQAIPAGFIMAFELTEPPEGWLECKGQEISRQEYPRLSEEIGSRFGQASTTLVVKLPDMRGRLPKGPEGEQKSGQVLASQVGAHTHAGRTEAGGVHNHGGRTNNAGNHGHGGRTHGAGAHSHSGSTNTTGSHTHHVNAAGASDGSAAYTMPASGTGGPYSYTQPAGAHSHSFSSSWNGAHTHSIQLNTSGAHTHSFSTSTNGNHTHAVTVADAGSAKTKARGIATLYCIKV